MTALPNLTLVLGGAASGKSAFAEGLVIQSGRPRVYLATAQAFDAEMAAKVARHREARGPDWQTIEESIEIGVVLSGIASGQAVLLDCATLWLSNWLIAGRSPDAAPDAFWAAVAGCPAPIVVVSNEVGHGIVPDNALARQFRAAQGALNQRLAAEAALAVMVVAGLPLVLKGRLP
jgi:adenosylcobinamide kinase/adenosylcobinamide-phosphate guanylyltransferase